MMEGEEMWQMFMNSSLDEFSIFNATHSDDDATMMLNDFQVPHNHFYDSQNDNLCLKENDNLCFNPQEFSFSMLPDHFTGQKFVDISFDDISHAEFNNTPALVPSEKSEQYTHSTEEEQRSSHIGLEGYDPDAFSYYPITEVQPKDESYNSFDQVVDQNFNENLYFDPDDLLKDLDQLQNESSFPSSVNHFAAVNTADTEMDINHTQLNHAPVILVSSTAALVPSTRPRECKHWTEKEQSLFLKGLKRYGWGKWKKISDDFVTTRTKTQVASHAQKYLQRVKAPKEKKIRKSIHDMTLQQEKDVRAAPNFDQQTRAFYPNFGTPPLQRVKQLSGQFITPNLATQQFQEVQQFQCNVPYQMNGFGYLGDGPCNIQSDNWVPYPIQSHAMQVMPTSQFAMGSGMEDLGMFQGQARPLLDHMGSRNSFHKRKLNYC